MNGIQVIQRLHEHRQWSNQQLLDAARQLDQQQLQQQFKIGMGSIWATLVHLYAVDLAWMNAIGGDPSGTLLTEHDITDWTMLNERWAEVTARIDALLGALTDDDLERPVQKARVVPGSSEQSMHTTSLGDALLNLCTHSMYTTAQAVNMLRHLGVEQLPDVQFIRMAREQAGSK